MNDSISENFFSPWYYVRTAIIIIFIFTILTGIIYPIFITGISQLIFPFQANGSLVTKSTNSKNIDISTNVTVIGSTLIGQNFKDPKYFMGRPSATTPKPYNAMNSSGSNLGPSNPDYINGIKSRISTIQKQNPDSDVKIPIDIITASGSGLDPHISPKAAFYQIKRIAKARNLKEDDLIELVNNMIEKRQFRFLGEPRVNVLKLNIALDALSLENGF